MDFSKGSEWRKWDLHIHTPISLVNNYSGSTLAEKWETFISDLEKLPPEFKVIGINDYLFIDGYEKVLEYKKLGRISNITTIFPVIEFRIKKFGGHAAFKRINFHIIFSDKINASVIKQQFLHQLYGKYKLAPGVEGIEWKGYINTETLSDFGKNIKASVPAEKLQEYGSDLEEGFNNLNFEEDEVIEILQTTNTYLQGKFLTAIGKTEWDAFSWNESSIAEKKTVINKVDFVFTSSENILTCLKAKERLKTEGVNSLLLDCSDAHWNLNSVNKDRIGKCFTWIKADPTFEGLKQVLIESDRVFIGSQPDLLQRILLKPNKIIEKISLQRISGSSMAEEWYNNLQVPINPGLVAIIGNKGNGKSALTDVIGLIGNSFNENYSFLTKSKFRNPRPFNKASQIEAKLHWLDGTIDGFLSLDKNIDKSRPEKVKYIPQNFLEALCVTEDEREFENEIKKIIFSHTSTTERIGFENLDDILAYKSEIINKDLGYIKGEIDDLNQQVINTERKTKPSYKKGVLEQLDSKKNELVSHRNSKPGIVEEPAISSQISVRNNLIEVEIEKLKTDQRLKENRRTQLTEDNAILSIDIAELEKSLQSFNAVDKTIDSLLTTQTETLKRHSISIEQVFSYKLDVTILESRIEEKEKALRQNSNELIGGIDTQGLLKELQKIKESLISFEQQLDEPFRLYQNYLNNFQDWQKRESEIIGDVNTPNSITNYENQIRIIEEILPAELTVLVSKRERLIEKLFSKKKEIISLYSTLYKPISDFIDQYGNLMKDYSVNLAVEFSLDGFTQKFFDHISQGARGTYIGIEEGYKFLIELISQFDFNNSDGLIEFSKAIIVSLKEDKRNHQTEIERDIDGQLKKGYSIEDFYRFLFNFDYLKPTFRLNLGAKSLSELSPGERGALLLIFYLFLDQDDRPLIIDQPEENLDNQSVYYYLVDFIKEAKKHRQIIIVTHNPNLAVVCDAEQIVHMTIDKTKNYKVEYIAGSIENPPINKAIVDILEGTKPAFANRTTKYSL